MILTLEVIGEQATDLGAGCRKVFNAIGGTIGRLPDNDWVFPDPYVSGRHALIRYLNGKFFVEDTSTNGVFINAPDSRLSKTQAHPLKNGDVLYIDAYEITVSIEKDATAEKQADDPFALLKGAAGRGNARENAIRNPIKNSGGTVREIAARGAPPEPAEEDRTASMAISGQAQQRRAEEDHDPGDHGTEWFGMSEMAAPKSAPPARARSEAVRPAAPARPLPRTPSRGSPPAVSRQSPESQPGSRPSTRPAPSSAQDETDHLRELLAAAGVDGVDPSSDLARTCGEILRVVVSGLMEVLRSREQMKEELRIRSTTFKAAHNNPLKFSANADDAFHNLLVKHNPAYLAPTDAFEDALHDVRDHQTAVLAAMRLAFETMLAQFDPSRLQEDFDRQLKKGSILGVPAKLRYWDLYREKYGDMARDAQTSFQNLFGNEFAKAYEEQMERLKARERHPAGRNGKR